MYLFQLSYTIYSSVISSKKHTILSVLFATIHAFLMSFCFTPNM